MKWTEVDPEVLKIYTHIADEASQAAMQRLAEAHGTHPQPPEKKPNSPEFSSAQFQPTTEDD
jgi:hypothetical protein